MEPNMLVSAKPKGYVEDSIMVTAVSKKYGIFENFWRFKVDLKCSNQTQKISMWGKYLDLVIANIKRYKISFSIQLLFYISSLPGHSGSCLCRRGCYQYIIIPAALDNSGYSKDDAWRLCDGKIFVVPQQYSRKGQLLPFRGRGTLADRLLK